MAGSTQLILEQIASPDVQERESKRTNEQGCDVSRKVPDENTPILAPKSPGLSMANLLKNCLQPQNAPNPDLPK